MAEGYVSSEHDELDARTRWFQVMSGLTCEEKPVGQFSEINTLPLSVRAKNCLNRAGISTIDELCAVNGEFLMGIRNMGVKTCCEILTYIKSIKQNSFDTVASEISGLPLSERAKNCLNMAGISTIDELCAVNEEFLMGIQNMGAKTCREILTYMESIEQNSCETVASEIGGLPLSAEAISCVTTAGISSVDELLSLNIEVLSRIKNVRIKTCKEIADYIEFRSFSVDANNKKIPIALLKNIGLCDTEVEFLLHEGHKIVEDLYARQISAQEYTCIKRVAKYLSVSVVTHFKDEIKDLTHNARICAMRRCNGATLQEIGDELGFTRERARQIIVSTCRQLSGTADMIASVLFAEGEGFFSLLSLQHMLCDEQLVQLYKLVLKESGYVRSFNFSDKFVCADICPPDIERRLMELVRENLGDSFNFCDNIENIDSELQKQSMGFFDSTDIKGYLIRNGYRFYGDYVTRGRQSYAHICYDAVMKYFAFDIKLDSEKHTEDMILLRQIISKYYQGLNLPLNNRALTGAVTRDPAMFVLSGRGRYCPVDRILYNAVLLEDVRNYIYDSQQPSFYYCELYAHFEDRLNAETNIHNYNFLHGVLKCFFPSDFTYEKDLLVKRNVERQDVCDRISDLIKQRGGAVTRTDIRKAIPGINDSVMMSATIRVPELIQWDYNEFNHIDNIEASPEDINNLREIIEEWASKYSGYCSSSLLYTGAEERCQEFFEKNHISNTQNLFYVARHFLGKEYHFKRPHIVTTDFPIHELSIAGIARVLLKNDRRLNYGDFFGLARELAWSESYLPTAYIELGRDYIRISKDDYERKIYFVLSSTVIESLAVTLSKIVAKNGFYALGSNFDFSGFPMCDYQWNGFLLESIINEFNLGFRVLYPQERDRRYQRGVIVFDDSQYHSFEDLIVGIMIENSVYSITEAGLETFLRMHGIINTTLLREFYEMPRMQFKDEVFLIEG